MVSTLAVIRARTFTLPGPALFRERPVTVLKCICGMTGMHANRIESGTPEGDALGFVESLYSGWIEIRDNHLLYLHFIISRYKNEGNTQALIRRWIMQGYDVRVVMPRPIMQHILQKLHFVRAEESLPEWYEGIIECWRRPVAWLLSPPNPPGEDQTPDENTGSYRQEL